MIDKTTRLSNNEDGSKQIKVLISQKKLQESNRRLGGICRSLLNDTEVYDPKRTIKSIDSYIASTEKIDRILYSTISGFIVGLDENSRAIYSTNVGRLLQFVLNDENQVAEDTKKICIKLYDHFQLNLIQIESASVITKDAISEAMKDEIENSHREIKGIQKEYITILGIFASIMLAFVGAFTFSTSVLNNLGKAETLDLVVIALVIGLVFVLLISILIDFLREINDKVIRKRNGKRKWNTKIIASIGVLAFVAVITIISLGVSKMSFPVKINIGNHQYQLVDEVANGSGNISSIDNGK